MTFKSKPIFRSASDDQIIKKGFPERGLLQGEGKILIMDDQYLVRSSIADMLVDSGYEVDHAADGKEAINKYRQAMKSSQPFDALIMDLTVPEGMGGKEALEKLLEIDPEVKAMVSSGYPDDPVMANYKKFGFRDALSKPYNPEILIPKLCRLLNQ